MFHLGAFTPAFLQKMNEYYASVTFIVKQVNKLNQDLRIRANGVAQSGYTLLSDMKSTLCQLRHNISASDAGHVAIRNLPTNHIVSPCVGMTRGAFFQSAIHILYGLRRLSRDTVQHLESNS